MRIDPRRTKDLEARATETEVTDLSVSRGEPTVVLSAESARSCV